MQYAVSYLEYLWALETAIYGAAVILNFAKLRITLHYCSAIFGIYIHRKSIFGNDMAFCFHLNVSANADIQCVISLGTHLTSMYLKLYVKTNIVVTLDKVWWVQ